MLYLNPLAAEFFSTLQGHGDNFYILSPGTEFFNFYCLAQTFFFDTLFPVLRIESPSLSTVKDKRIYFFKAENQEN